MVLGIHRAFIAACYRNGYGREERHICFEAGAASPQAYVEEGRFQANVAEQDLGSYRVTWENALGRAAAAGSAARAGRHRVLTNLRSAERSAAASSNAAART